MTVPIESIKPGTMWRFKHGPITVREIDPCRNYVGIIVDSQWYSGKLTEFARHAIEQVTAIGVSEGGGK